MIFKSINEIRKHKNMTVFTIVFFLMLFVWYMISNHDRVIKGIIDAVKEYL